MVSQLQGLFRVFRFPPQRPRRLNVVHVRFSPSPSFCDSAETRDEQRRPVMKKFAKLALGALMVAGAATATTAAITTPAEARVSVGIGIGPGYYGGGYYGPRYGGCYRGYYGCGYGPASVSYTHLRAHETGRKLV